MRYTVVVCRPPLYGEECSDPGHRVVVETHNVRNLDVLMELLRNLAEAAPMMEDCGDGTWEPGDGWLEIHPGGF